MKYVISHSPSLVLSLTLPLPLSYSHTNSLSSNHLAVLLAHDAHGRRRHPAEHGGIDGWQLGQAAHEIRQIGLEMHLDRGTGGGVREDGDDIESERVRQTETDGENGRERRGTEKA